MSTPPRDQDQRGYRYGMFSAPAAAIMSMLLTGCIALIIAISGSSKTTSYDRDRAFIQSTLQTNTQNISDLTQTVQQLAVTVATLQEQVSTLTPTVTK